MLHICKNLQCRENLRYLTPFGFLITALLNIDSIFYSIGVCVPNIKHDDDCYLKEPHTTFKENNAMKMIMVSNAQ